MKRQNQNQIQTLKDGLFSHVRGEITFKLYLSVKEHVKGGGGAGGDSGGGGTVVVPGGVSKKNKKFQQNTVVQNHQQMGMGGGGQENKKMTHPNQMTNKSDPNELKPVVITSIPGPPIPAMNVALPGGGGGGNGGRMGVFSGGGSNEYSLKETKPHLGGGLLNKDKTSSTYDLVEQMQYLYIKLVKGRDISVAGGGGGGGGEVVAEVKLGNYRGITKRGPLAKTLASRVRSVLLEDSKVVLEL